MTLTTRNSQRKQCWECHRRRLVCDSTRPACTKCHAAGIDCPGYDEKKPLKWLPPGKVTSRNRRRRNPDAGDNEGHIQCLNPTSQSVKAASNSKDEDDIEIIPRNTEPDHLDPISPPYILTTDTCTFVQTVCYYNYCIYPDFASLHELAPNPYVQTFPFQVMHLIPEAMQHTLTWLAITHRISKVRSNSDPSCLVRARSTLYHHRGLAIRTLGREIGNPRTRTSDVTILNILLFLFAEIRDSISLDWRHHYLGAAKLIMLRGGLEEYYRASPLFKPLLIYFMIIGVIGNTTSPAADQISAASRLDTLDLASELYGEGLFPCLLCPPQLFLDIININHLRAQGGNGSFANDFNQSAAEAVLTHIETFDPEQWASPDSRSREEWLLLGSLYRSAVTLYCILSLQSVSILPSTPRLNALRWKHGRCLTQLLSKALKSERIRMCMMWPLVVAGVEAVNGSEARRNFVTRNLLEMSESLGTPLPLRGNSVLKKFWDSGKSTWDECFDRPYAFVT